MRIPARFTLFNIQRMLALLVSLGLLITASGALAASPPPDNPTSNPQMLMQGLPLPVFKFMPPSVTGEATQSLANHFAPLAEQVVHEDSYLGNARFTVGNEGTGAILQQYGATGGFYAFNPMAAYGETARGKWSDNLEMDKADARYQACMFLLTHELMPTGGVSIDLPSGCDYDFLKNPIYNVTEIMSNTEGTVPSQAEAILIGLVVKIPMSVNVGQWVDLSPIPLGGPGGHISLLLNTLEPDEGFTLDAQNAPGLTSAALPFYGRQLNMESVSTFPSRSTEEVMKEVEAQVRSSYPGADYTVEVPVPTLNYWVSDAAQPQTTLEPTFEFDGITVKDKDGNPVTVLKTLVVPAVEGGATGLGPTVTIISPDNGSKYKPGQPVSIVGSIADGVSPYHFTWMLDDGTVLGEGNQENAGDVSLTTSSLPAISHAGTPGPALIWLSVTDADDVTRTASLTLTAETAPSIWMPLLTSGTAASGLSADSRVTTTGQVEPYFANYSFGVESGSDYPPYGPGGSDLPGVVPDASGFRSHMLDYGWSQRFYWSNASAWEKDWRDCSLGGIDCTWGVDRVDFAYWAGHGSNGGISLPSSVNSSWFPGENARYSTLRWAGFASCLTLRAQWSPASEAPIRRWFNAFQGAHMLLGFNSLMADVAFGPRLVDNMRMPTFLGLFDMPWAQMTIREAWVHTAFTMNAGKPAYIYAIGTNGVNPVDNKLPKPNDPPLPRPYPVASWHWVWWND